MATLPAPITTAVSADKSKVKLAKSVADAQAMSNTPQPSIAQQVLAEAQGIERAQSNLPQTYAGGGIIAFANRGLVDDDEEEDDDFSVTVTYDCKLVLENRNAYPDRVITLCEQLRDER